jgi:hypothetical protein
MSGKRAVLRQRDGQHEPDHRRAGAEPARHGLARERERATAYEHQRGRVSKLEADSGVRVGAPVAVDDPEAGVVFTRRRRPSAGAWGSTRTARARGRPGAAAPATRPRDGPEAAEDRQAGRQSSARRHRPRGGRQLADQILRAPCCNARSLLHDAWKPAYGQHEGAARQAVMDVLPDGAKQNWGFGKYTPKGEPRTNLGPIALTGPTKRRARRRAAPARHSRTRPGARLRRPPPPDSRRRLGARLARRTNSSWRRRITPSPRARSASRCSSG